MSLKNYLKRAIKFVLYGEKENKVYVECVQKSSTDYFKGKTIFITGGGRGLGYYMAKRFAEDGGKVIISGRNEEVLSNAQKAISGDVDYIVFDVNNLEQGKDIFNIISSKYGEVDILINNAGVSLHEKNILEVTEEDFQKQFDVNLKGSYFLAKSYIKYVKERKLNGNIIFISSERGKQCDDIPYGLTKVAINSLVEGLSRRFYKDGIRVNAVAPGVTASDMTSINKDSNLFAQNASGRFFIPEEVAEVVAFLASDYSKCISGEIIHCNCGQHLNPWFK